MSEIEHPTDAEIAMAMKRYGGSFVAALGEAVLNADAANRSIIREAFFDYWQTYREFAISTKKREQQNGS